MNAELQHELRTAITSDRPLDEIVLLLRHCKENGVTQAEVYCFLEECHHAVPDEATDARILEVADFVAGFCAPQMRVWDAPFAT